MELPTECDPMQRKVWYLAGACRARKQNGNPPLQKQGGAERAVILVKSQARSEPKNNKGQKAKIQKKSL